MYIYIEVVDLLVARGGNLDEKNNGGLTPRLASTKVQILTQLLVQKHKY
jgi:hypothetical protein